MTPLLEGRTSGHSAATLCAYRRAKHFYGGQTPGILNTIKRSPDAQNENWVISVARTRSTKTAMFHIVDRKSLINIFDPVGHFQYR
jgi:hypothetical protein